MAIEIRRRDLLGRFAAAGAAAFVGGGVTIARETADLSKSDAMMYLVMSWDCKGKWCFVEGIFHDEMKARDVARIQNRTIAVGPIEEDTVLEDLGHWPGLYYVYPEVDGRSSLSTTVDGGSSSASTTIPPGVRVE